MKTKVNVLNGYTKFFKKKSENKSSFLSKNVSFQDRVYDHFVRNDTFDGLGVPQVPLNRNLTDFFIQLFWLVTIGIPSLFWFFKFILFSSILAKLIFAVILLVAYLIIQRMINMSVIQSDLKTKTK